MRKLILGAGVLMALGGCASVPTQLAGDHFAALTPRDAAKQSGSGQQVRWGGEIIAVEPRSDVTCFQILARELYPDARPKRHDQSDGRFMACSKGFYDPEEYSRGRDITVVGTLNGTEKHKVGEFDYTFPLVTSDQVYMWPKRQHYDYYDPWTTYYDPFWGPAWGWGGYWSPRPVVIVRPSGPHH